MEAMLHLLHVVFGCLLGYVFHTSKLSPTGRDETLSFKCPEIHKEELLAITMSLNLSYKNDIESMVHWIVGVQRFILPYYSNHSLVPKGVCCELFQVVKIYSLVVKFIEKVRKLEVSLFSFYLCIYKLINLSIIKIACRNLILNLLQGRNEILNPVKIILRSWDIKPVL